MTFIVKPLVTEKMTKLTDKSSVAKTYKVKGQERTKKAETKYGFIVLPEANKLEIKKEIETRYNVTVLDVNTMVYAGKRRAVIHARVSLRDRRTLSRKQSSLSRRAMKSIFTAISKIKNGST